MDISCIILAGGKGLRLGRNKTSQIVGGRSLLERVVSGVSFLKSEIIIVTAVGRPLTQSVSYSKLRIVDDIYPCKSSLGGIHAGLSVSNSLYNLIVACDMPFLNEALLRYMIQVSADYDLVIPRLGRFVEPLHAVYSRNCLAPIEHMIKQNNLRIMQLPDLVRVRYVDAEDINRFDPTHLSFFNINTEADLKRAGELAKGDTGP